MYSDGRDYQSVTVVIVVDMAGAMEGVAEYFAVYH